MSIIYFILEKFFEKPEFFVTLATGVIVLIFAIFNTKKGERANLFSVTLFLLVTMLTLMITHLIIKVADENNIGRMYSYSIVAFSFLIMMGIVRSIFSKVRIEIEKNQ